MPVKLITDQPAAFITEEKALVIADVQIGLEHELYKKGIVIHAQVDKFLRTLDKMIKMTKAEKLIIVGDLKHSVPGTSLREDKEIIRFFDHLLKKVKVVLVKGNHDTALNGLLPKSVKVYDSGGFGKGKYGFFHGHAWPSKSLLKCDTVFMGHLQPGVEFKDEMGHRTVERVWLKSEADRETIEKRYGKFKAGKLGIIVIPAFNKLLGSAPVNKMAPEDYHNSAFGEALGIPRSKVYMLDGTYIGRLDKIDI